MKYGKNRMWSCSEVVFSFKEMEIGLNKENIISKAVLLVMLVTFFPGEDAL